MKKVCPSITPQILREALEASTNGIVISEVKGEQSPIIYVNPAFESMTGYLFEDVIGKDCRVLNRNARKQKELETIREALKQQKPCMVTILNHKKNGEPFWNELSLSPVFSQEGALTHYIGVQKDVTKQIEHQKQLEELVIRDPLTGLYNRRYLESELDKFWSIHQRQESPIAIVFIDIDYFKTFNDSYGHLEGDKAIKSVAKKLSSMFSRKADVIARFGGEEFVAVVSLKKNLEVFRKHLESLRTSIENLKIVNKGSKVGPYLTISIGVCYGIPPEGTSPSLFTREADAAMYRAKQSGRNTVEIIQHKEKAISAKKRVS